MILKVKGVLQPAQEFGQHIPPSGGVILTKAERTIPFLGKADES